MRLSKISSNLRKATAVGRAVYTGDVVSLAKMYLGNKAVNEAERYADRKFKKYKGYRLAKNAGQLYLDTTHGNIVEATHHGLDLAKEILGKKRTRQFEESKIGNYLSPALNVI